MTTPPPAELERLGCAIVTFNPDLDRLMLVVRAALAQVSRVLVIDNASRDAPAVRSVSARVAEGRRDVVRHLQWDVNRGLGAAYNAAIAWAHESNLTHLILLDQDSVLHDGAVAHLVHRDRRETEAGHHVAAVAGVPLDPRRRKAVGSARRRVVQASGCMISLMAADRVGLFDEALFIHHVDQDWFLRARRAGFTTVVEPQALLDHLSGDAITEVGPWSFPRYSPGRFYYVVRNTLLVARRPYVPLSWKARYLAELIAQAVLHLAAARDGRAYRDSLVRGVRDGLGRGGTG